MVDSSTTDGSAPGAWWWLSLLQSDREITRRIRRSLVKDESLSTYAHNVKIITRDGQVTLKGPVRSVDEKRAIETKATEVAGENKVTNELENKPQQQD